MGKRVCGCKFVIIVIAVVDVEVVVVAVHDVFWLCGGGGRGFGWWWVGRWALWVQCSAGKVVEAIICVARDVKERLVLLWVWYELGIKEGGTAISSIIIRSESKED